MAQFSQALLGSLTQSPLKQGMFDLGQTIGAAPGMAAEKEAEKKKLQEVDAAFQTTMQGTAAAQQGDVAAVTQKMNTLRQSMAASTTLEEKQMYAKEIQALQNMVPAAQKIQTTNKAQSILKAEQAIKDPALAEQARNALISRIEEMKKDPEALKQYNDYKMEEWRTSKAQEDIQADKWIANNGASITAALREDNYEEVQALIDKAGPYAASAQAYVARAQQTEAAMRQLQENSIEKKTAPSVDMWEEKINSLPEELQKSFEASFNAYKKIAEDGYNENTKTWDTGARSRANNLEKEMQGLYNNLNNQLAVSEFSAARRETRWKEEKIRELELAMEAPVSLTEARSLAASTLRKNKTLTVEDIQLAQEQLRANRNAGLQAQLDLLREPAEDSTGGSVTTTEEKVRKALDKGFSPDAIRQNLLDEGVDAAVIDSLLPSVVPAQNNGALGTSYMSSAALAPDIARVNRIRSNISPMGTYTNG